jgi:hypothetical protein
MKIAGGFAAVVLIVAMVVVISFASTFGLMLVAGALFKSLKWQTLGFWQVYWIQLIAWWLFGGAQKAVNSK